jgi:hypothetical protein
MLLQLLQKCDMLRHAAVGCGFIQNKNNSDGNILRNEETEQIVDNVVY